MGARHWTGQVIPACVHVEVLGDTMEPLFRQPEKHASKLPLLAFRPELYQNRFGRPINSRSKRVPAGDAK
jgi:hypothetical protein